MPLPFLSLPNAPPIIKYCLFLVYLYAIVGRERMRLAVNGLKNIWLIIIKIVLLFIEFYNIFSMLQAALGAYFKEWTDRIQIF